MTRHIIITVMFLLCLYSVNAQWTSKKTAITISDDYTTGAENVFSITKDHKPETPDYVVIQSDVEIPIAYESTLYSSNTTETYDLLEPNNEGLAYNKAVSNSVGGKSDTGFQSFAVFTIVDTNALEVAEEQDDAPLTEEESHKYLPSDFDAYKGMFSDKINAETMLNPITSY